MRTYSVKIIQRHSERQRDAYCGEDLGVCTCHARVDQGKTLGAGGLQASSVLPLRKRKAKSLKAAVEFRYKCPMMLYTEQIWMIYSLTEEE